MSEAAHVFPSQLEIKPLLSPPKASVRVPGSKSMTNRALVLAALASRSGKCELLGVLRGEDTEIMVDALRALGFRLCPDWEANRIEMRQVTPDGVIPSHSADLFVGNSGTTMRFLTALVASGKGEFRLDGVSRMRERPIEDLLAALRQLGVRAESENGNGFPPVHIHSEGLKGGRVRIRGDISSQFLSGLLMAAPYASGGVTIGLEGPLVSGPYVDLTIAMMRRFGVEVDSRNTYFEVAPQRYQPRSYEIEPDASAASYFWAAAAITGGDIGVQGLDNASLQGDVRFIKILDEMGCHVRHGNKSVRVLGDKLRGITADMNDISDTVMSLAAAACFAEGPTTIRNVAHIRHKETDRLAALATELRRVGAAVTEFHDGITIEPRPLHGAVIETYNDHRMAMSMALIGLKVPGIVIDNPGCVAKTYPNFFTDLESLR